VEQFKKKIKLSEDNKKPNEEDGNPYDRTVILLGSIKNNAMA
jgi:hypothetical protein